MFLSYEHFEISDNSYFFRPLTSRTNRNNNESSVSEIDSKMLIVTLFNEEFQEHLD